MQCVGQRIWFSLKYHKYVKRNGFLTMRRKWLNGYLMGNLWNGIGFQWRKWLFSWKFSSFYRCDSVGSVSKVWRLGILLGNFLYFAAETFQNCVLYIYINSTYIHSIYIYIAEHVHIYKRTRWTVCYKNIYTFSMYMNFIYIHFPYIYSWTCTYINAP